MLISKYLIAVQLEDNSRGLKPQLVVGVPFDEGARLYEEQSYARDEMESRIKDQPLNGFAKHISNPQGWSWQGTLVPVGTGGILNILRPIRLLIRAAYASQRHFSDLLRRLRFP